MTLELDDYSQKRIAYDLIIQEIPEKSRVLDLGCGDGSLLEELQKLRKIDGYGVEISPEGVSACVERGLYVYQGDIDDGLSDYKSNSFDYVILNQTLHYTKRPRYVISEILRICRSAIISFPNFAHCSIRFGLLCRGMLPKNRLLPYEWHEAPNTHHLSIRDFSRYCAANSYPVKKMSHFSLGKDGSSRVVGISPNFCAEFGFFILDGERFVS